MSVCIEVTAYAGKPLSVRLAAEFDELGGSIGRGKDSTLLLPDAERHISRIHALIVFRAGHYVIQDKGISIPVHINGRPVGSGNEATIAHGDELRIGDYTLQVSLQAATTSPPPGAAAIFGVAKDDPLAAFGGASPAIADPFAAPRSERSAAPSASVIPTNFDPFADAVAPGAPPSSARLPDDIDFGLEGVPSQRFDELFGIGVPASRDPLAAHAPPNIAGVPASDPLVALGMADATPVEFQPAQRDDTPELNSAFRPPQAKPDDMVLSWDRSQAPVTAAPNGASMAKSAPQVPTRARTPEINPPVPVSAQASVHPVMAGASDEQLLRAFLRGAGVPDLNVPGGITPQWMELLGQVVREATQGTLELLLARALTKREMRANATMIVARENNPLKFSPNVEAALQHLLVPQERGFMDPQSALRDAYDDLRSHQFGIMCGMRAALAGVLQRFDPEKLEQRLTHQRVLDSLLPINRKASLWMMFSELYQELSKEAEDDFHALFGREFLRAYQAQIASLRQAKNDSKD